jgi:hypothetical protein
VGEPPNSPCQESGGSQNEYQPYNADFGLVSQSQEAQTDQHSDQRWDIVAVKGKEKVGAHGVAFISPLDVELDLKDVSLGGVVVGRIPDDLSIRLQSGQGRELKRIAGFQDVFILVNYRGRAGRGLTPDKAHPRGVVFTRGKQAEFS